MPEALMPVEVFCSYAHEDEIWLHKLEAHLRLLEQQGLIALWHDRLIIPGTNWAKTIDTHLDTASVILLLVSKDFFASNYCVGIEMQRALIRQRVGEAFVIPILVSEVNWLDAPFAHLQALPTDALPISNWPDEETALVNVAAGIRRAIEELPLLAASAPRAVLPALWNIPYPHNPFFLGRDDELIELHSHLQADHVTALSQPQAINGLGGIGKTQLALEYAYRYHQNYQAILWAGAENADALISSFIALATLLQLPEREAREQSVTVQAVKTWLQTHREWLLILDNADDLTLLPDFLPPNLEGQVLLTTRAAVTGRLARRLEIKPLLPEQGALFLLRRAALLASDASLEQASLKDRELALQIYQELGGLPLALDQAGAYMEETGTDLTGYWAIYQQHRVELLQLRGGLIADHPAPVATTWSLSFKHIEEKNPAAADLLRVCAYLAPDAIAEEILTEGASSLGAVLAPVAADAFRLNQAIEALRAHSLVRRDPGGKTLSVHRLVQAVLKDEMKEAEKQTWTTRVIQAVNLAFPLAEQSTWPQCERLLPHTLLLAQDVEQQQIISEDAGNLLHKTATYLHDRARYSEAEPLYQHALHIWEQQLRPPPNEMTRSLNGLAEIYREQGKYTEAEPLYQRTLQIREQHSGLEHPDVAQSLNNLANLYYQQGKYVEVGPLFQRSLHIIEQQSGFEDIQAAFPLNGLATLYKDQGKYVEAEPLYQRSALIFEKHLGHEHIHLAIPLNNLAELYREQGKFAEAEPLYQRALTINTAKLGPEHPQVGLSLNNLAELYLDQREFAKAEPLFQHALAIWEQQLGQEHPLVAYPLNSLALLFFEQGKFAEAEPLFQRALHIREQTVGFQHPDTAKTMYSLAQLQEAQGNFEAARDWYTRALTIYEQTLGVNHSKTTETRDRFNALPHTSEQHVKAIQLELTTTEQEVGK